MVQGKVEILHIEGLLKGLNEASGELTDKLVEALNKAGLMVEIPAARAAKELFEHPTGNLPSSIHTEVMRAELTARVGTNLEYSALREFGGTVEGAWGRAITHHVGRPYLLPAFKGAQDKIKALFGEMLDKMTSKIANKTKEGR